MMDQFSRSTPGLEIKAAEQNWLGIAIAGLALFLMACFGGYAFYTFIKTERFLEGVICLLFAGFMGFMAMTALLSSPLQVLIKLLAKQEWYRTAVRVQVPVLDSKYAYNPWNRDPEDTYDDDDLYDCELALTLPVEITHAAQPKTYWVAVNQAAYRRCSGKKNVWLYYTSNNPAMFLVEGE
jgi:hypothetical protein